MKELFTGKNKEQFEKWCLEQSKKYTLVNGCHLAYKFDGSLSQLVYWNELPFKMQLGVILAYLIKERGVTLTIYNNASGWMWSICKAKGGTMLGHNWDIKKYYTFTEYNDCFKDALKYLNLKTLEEFKEESKPFHWGNYASFLGKQ